MQQSWDHMIYPSKHECLESPSTSRQPGKISQKNKKISKVFMHKYRESKRRSILILMKWLTKSRSPNW